MIEIKNFRCVKGFERTSFESKCVTVEILRPVIGFDFTGNTDKNDRRGNRTLYKTKHFHDRLCCFTSVFNTVLS